MSSFFESANFGGDSNVSFLTLVSGTRGLDNSTLLEDRDKDADFFNSDFELNDTEIFVFLRGNVFNCRLLLASSALNECDGFVFAKSTVLCYLRLSISASVNL